MVESASTLHGQLQRGLGRAARRAAERRGAGEYVYDCLRRDPRWDRQCESRGLYYARLMVDLELPVGPVADHLFDPADQADDDGRRSGPRVGLALETLAAMVRLSRREAAEPLRRYADEGAHWFDALDLLVRLRDPALTWDLDDLVDGRCDEHDLAQLAGEAGNPVLEMWAARKPRVAAALAERRERMARRPVGPRRDPRDRLARSGGAAGVGGGAGGPSDTELVELARQGDDTAIAALFELGRRRVPALLDLAEELLPQRKPRWIGAVGRAVEFYGAEALPRARVWAASPGPFAYVGLRMIANHGTRQDIPLLMDELTDALDREDWGAAAEPVEGLGRLRAGEAVPLLKSAWTDTEYSFLRRRVLTSLIRTAPHTAESYTVEGLWDCEEPVRQTAVEAAPITEETRTRLQRLALDVPESPELRASAAARLT
ncbi:hypothetical protein EBO15_23330 [Actinomadura harenae]|uniref:HEAT repeat domain-containing protein n=1 Tax=Actinomadura harenae TaxID=2483351 RepID=A0A3M2LVM5_9ACTN|nr:hypothetical protein EBO15_23330 [Actinomadura harenae]